MGNYNRGFSVKLSSIFIMFLLTSTILLANGKPSNELNYSNGTTGSPLTSTEIAKLSTCDDPALAIIDCKAYLATGDWVSDVTILVMDSALHPDEWDYLEHNTDANIHVDIVAYTYMVWDADEEIDYQITLHTSDQLRDMNNEYPYEEINPTRHGSTVLSSIAQIARNVKIVYMATDIASIYQGYDLFADNENTDVVAAYDWIVANKDSYGGIDIISVSLSLDQQEERFFTVAQSNTLMSYGIYMLTSAGNNGVNFNGVNQNGYPNKQLAWFTVGAINPDGTIWTDSSYGSTTEDAADATDYVMPGSGVPVYDGINGWTYADGTSFSAPYLAATIAVLIEEYRENEGNGNNPTIDKINEILKSLRNNTFDQKLGHGYINVYELYISLQPEPEEEDPPSGGGGGGGGSGGGGGCTFYCLDP